MRTKKSMSVPLAGNCSDNRNRGYDLGRRPMWVEDGCGGPSQHWN